MTRSSYPANEMLELALTESVSLRRQHADKLDVLDKVKHLIMLPDGAHATIEMVADFFEVPPKTIASVARRHRVELESRGLDTLRGPELRKYKDRFRVHLSSSVLQAPQLTVFSRAAILTVGMLLTESEAAAQVRHYLVALEATATPEHKLTAVAVVRLQERGDYRNVLGALKKGGAEADDYRAVQNALYLRLFDQSAQAIRTTQPQMTGTPRKDGKGLRKSNVAKDHLTHEQLRLLNSATLSVVAQLEYRYPDGATRQQVIDAVEKAAVMLRGSIAA